MIKPFYLALALLASGASSALAQTGAEKAACRSDAVKYCSSDIGNPKAMFACLEQHKADISEACLKVVEAHGG